MTEEEQQQVPKVEDVLTVVNEEEKGSTVESKEILEMPEKPLEEPIKMDVNNSETQPCESEQKPPVITPTPDVMPDVQPSIPSLEESQPEQSSQEHINPVLVESPHPHDNSKMLEESQQHMNVQEQPEQDKSNNLSNEVIKAPESIEISQPPPSNQPDSEQIPETGKNEDNSVDNSMITSDVPSQSPPTQNPGTQVEFNTAMAKVKEIAAKLGVKPTIDSTSPQNHNNNATQQGVKRSHDDSYSSHGSRDSRDDYRDDYRRDSYNRRDRGSRYEDYGRESKRAAYDDNGGRHRYGLGSEERRSHHGSHYGPGGDSSRSTTHEEFKVPNAVVGLVIGRGGENLKRIEKQTGARIQFSQDQPPDVVERRVTITGTPEDVKSAKGMVQQLVEDAINGNSTSRRDSQGFSRSITIHIPSSKVGVVIGRGGETIRDLQDRSGARINVTPDSAASPQSNDRPVTLIGDDAAVQRAKALIDEIVNTGESSLSDRHPKDYRSNSYSGASTYSNDSHGSNYGSGGHYGPPSGPYGGPPGGKSNQDGITIQVPNDSVGLIIGKGGETVRALQQQSGARIQIEPVHGVPPAERNVQITGSSENIAIAKQLILEKAASGNVLSAKDHHVMVEIKEEEITVQGITSKALTNTVAISKAAISRAVINRVGGPVPGNTSGQNYQQNPGYLTSSYATPQQQPVYGQSTNSDYGQTNNTSGYPTSGSYGVPNQQQPQQQTSYSQYGQYPNQTQATTYNQYPTQTQYGAYGQPPQYNQISTGQPVGQSAGQPVMQQLSQPPNQQQVGYYQTQPAAVDQSKLGQPTEVKSDSQTVSSVPNYGYQQYGYSYGTTPVAATAQFSTAVGGQTQVTTATTAQVTGAYPVYNTASTGTAVNPPATSSAPGTGDQITTQQSYSVIMCELINNLVQLMPIPNVDGTDIFVGEIIEGADKAKIRKRNFTRKQSKKRRKPDGANKRRGLARRIKRPTSDCAGSAIDPKKSNNSNIRVIRGEDGQLKIVEGGDSDVDNYPIPIRMESSAGKGAGKPRKRNYARASNNKLRKNIKSTNVGSAYNGGKERTRQKKSEVLPEKVSTKNPDDSIQIVDDDSDDGRRKRRKYCEDTTVDQTLLRDTHENPIAYTEQSQGSEIFDPSSATQDNTITISSDNTGTVVIDVTGRKLRPMVDCIVPKSDMSSNELRKKWAKTQKNRIKNNQSVLAIGRKQDCREILQSEYARQFWKTREQTLNGNGPNWQESLRKAKSRNTTSHNYSIVPQRIVQNDRELQSHSRSSSSRDFPISTRTRSKAVPNSIEIDGERFLQKAVKSSPFPPGRGKNGNFELPGEIDSSQDAMMSDDRAEKTLIHSSSGSENNKDPHEWQIIEETVVMTSTNWEKDIHTESEEETVELVSDGWDDHGIQVEQSPSNQCLVSQGEFHASSQDSIQPLTCNEIFQTELDVSKENFEQNIAELEAACQELVQPDFKAGPQYSTSSMDLDETLDSLSRNMSDIIPCSPLSSFLERLAECSAMPNSLDSYMSFSIAGSNPSTEVDISFEDCLAYSQQSTEFDFSQAITSINETDVSFHDSCNGLSSLTTTPIWETENPLYSWERNLDLTSIYPLYSTNDTAGIPTDNDTNCQRLTYGPTGMDITLQDLPIKNQLLPLKREEEPCEDDKSLEDIRVKPQVKRKRRSKWSNLELETLEKGMEEYGTSWVKILEVHGKPHGHLRDRTAVQLKDKARNEKMRRARERIPTGIFEIATDYA
ncbi:17201_t:CDS:10 [Acaulospora colombiana]|uniref:17201_t:CDS:1 n=1 Tax=Acaulospora colombiana TaxID=27376 RepID=A0ACA9LI71_9GLOM|nr:17201_t:CDS:10 [Acaulospora colombiana]